MWKSNGNLTVHHIKEHYYCIGSVGTRDLLTILYLPNENLIHLVGGF